MLTGYGSGDYFVYACALQKGRSWRIAASFAWIRLRSSEGGDESYEVVAHDQQGERVLAAGPDIDKESLALANGHLYWRQGSVTSTSELH